MPPRPDFFTMNNFEAWNFPCLLGLWQIVFWEKFSYRASLLSNGCGKSSSDILFGYLWIGCSVECSFSFFSLPFLIFLISLCGIFGSMEKWWWEGNRDFLPFSGFVWYFGEVWEVFVHNRIMPDLVERFLKEKRCDYAKILKQDSIKTELHPWMNGKKCERNWQREKRGSLSVHPSLFFKSHLLRTWLVSSHKASPKMPVFPLVSVHATPDPETLPALLRCVLQRCTFRGDEGGEYTGKKIIL